MPGPIDCSGPIEAFCLQVDAPSSRRSVHSFDAISAGDRVALCFVADGSSPPYSLRVRSPAGALVIDRLLRELPTGQPQSEPPIEMVVSTPGVYQIELKEVRGTQYCKATLHVTA